MISFDEAIEVIRSVAEPLGTEVVPLARATGRVLAAPVVAAIGSPRADVSAMDGYALRSADLGVYPVSLKVLGESRPGAGWPGTVGPRTCARIFTGAPLPAGTDRIVIQEQVRRDGEMAVIDADPGPATWVRPCGRDFYAGDKVVEARRLLDPAALIAIAGADVAKVEVYRHPRLAVLTTGDELVEPGTARETPLAVPDSVSLGLAAFAAVWGAEVVTRIRLTDDLEAMKPKAEAAVDAADLIVVAGGASVGERDFAKAMFEPLGLHLLFSKISIRPGKPAWLGRVGDKLVFGLPGNPTSALVTARLLLAPLLCAVRGRSADAALDWGPARLGAPLHPCDLRETFHRASLRSGDATPVTFQESHAQKALAEANVLIRQPANSPAIGAGQTVRVLRL